IFHTGRYFDGNGLFLHLEPLGICAGRSFVNGLPGTPTSAARCGGLHPSQNGIGDLRNLSGTVTGGTSFIGHAIGLYLSSYLDFLFNPIGHFIQGQLHTDTQVATLHPALASATETAKTTEATAKCTSKNISELAENIFHVHTSTAK